jgi:hypothetical protein
MMTVVRPVVNAMVCGWSVGLLLLVRLVLVMRSMEMRGVEVELD